MVLLLLDKNPELETIDVIKQELERKTLSLIISNEALIKTSFFDKVLDETKILTIYIDFDFLYSGYVTAEIIKHNENIIIHKPNFDNFEDLLKNVVTQVSQKKTWVVIDSLNGIFALYDKKDSGRLVNAFLMLLSCVAKYSDSKILVGCVAKHVDDEGWILTPTGRHILDSPEMNRVYLSRKESEIQFQILDKKNVPISTMSISN